MSMLANPRPIDIRRRAGSLVFASSVTWFVACGGNAAVDGPGGNRAGASSSAGASSAAGTAGSAATEACTARKESGQCKGYIPSFWHDPKTGLCEPFVYGGCGGNANRYPSRDACLEACPVNMDDWGECANDKDCALIGASCCGACEPVAREDFVAINLVNSSSYEEAHCPEAPPCVPCPPIDEQGQTQKYLKPVCHNSRCTLIDVRESPLTECQSTNDCRIRNGAGCCAECSGTNWVALNKDVDLCGGAQAECDDCVSPLPADRDAVCLAGRCQIVLAPL